MNNPAPPRTALLRHVLVALALVGLMAFGWTYRIQYLEQTQVHSPIQGDAAEYVAYAANLVRHGVYSKAQDTQAPLPDAYRSPGYPLFLVLCHALGGERGLLPLLYQAQALLGVLSILLTYILGRFFLGRVPALLAALLVAASPHLVSMTGYILTETLFAFCLLLALVCSCAALGRPSPRSAFFCCLAGLAWGLCYLVNETALPFWPGLLLLAWLGGRLLPTQALRPRILALGLAVFLLFPLGWSIRNAVSLPPGAPANANRALATLTHGAYPDFAHTTPQGETVIMYEDPEHQTFGRSLSDFTRILWERVRERPGTFARWYLLQKPQLLWQWSIIQGQGDVFVYGVTTSLFHTSEAWFQAREVMRHLHPVLVLLAGGGLLVVFARGRAMLRLAPLGNTPLPVFCCLLGFTLLYTIFAPWPRYNIPLRPELSLAAAWTCVWLVRVAVERLRHGRTARRGAV